MARRFLPLIQTWAIQRAVRGGFTGAGAFLVDAATLLCGHDGDLQTRGVGYWAGYPSVQPRTSANVESRVC